MLHHPGQVVGPGAAQPVVVVVAGVVVPEGVVQGQDAPAVQGVEQVLVGEQQLLFVFGHIAEDLLRVDLPAGGGQVHQQHAGVVVVAAAVEAHPVDAVGQLCLSRVGGGRKQIARQVGLPQGAQGVEHQNVRVQIEHPVQRVRQQAGGQQPVVHLLGVLAADWGALEQGVIHQHREKSIAEGGALPFHFGQTLRRDGALKQIQVHVLSGVVQAQGGEQHVELRQVVLVQCG